MQKKRDIQCEEECRAELEPDLLIQGEKYEARVRVRSIRPEPEGAWSDWSPTASWESPVGKRKPPSGTFLAKWLKAKWLILRNSAEFSFTFSPAFSVNVIGSVFCFSTKRTHIL